MQMTASRGQQAGGKRQKTKNKRQTFSCGSGFQPRSCNFITFNAFNKSTNSLILDSTISAIYNENGVMKITNRRMLQVCRCFLLLVCLSAGGFLLWSGKSKGIGIFLLLVGPWFVLDNPLENFENLEGPCPFCGHTIQSRRRARFHCPE